MTRLTRSGWIALIMLAAALLGIVVGFIEFALQAIGVLP